MNTPEFLSESVLALLPGLILFKEVTANKSIFVWGNKYCAKLAGYKNNDSLPGISDADLKCEAAENAIQFFQDDKQVLQGNSFKTLDIYQYAVNDVIGLIGEKRTITTKDDKTSYILFSAQEITRSHMQILGHNFTTAIKSINKNTNKKTIVFVERYEKLKLTKRESECFFYLLRGKTANDIGQILGIKIRTVQTYLDAIKNKTGVNKKAELFDLAHDMGILNVIPNSLIDNKQTIVL